jgi:alkylhydroperoxidase family enzyme
VALEDSPVVASVLEHGPSADVDERLRAALALIEKFTLQPDELAVDDIRSASASGLTELEIEHALHVATLWNVFSRIADAFGFRVYKDELFRKGAPVVLRLGYRFPRPLWPRA